jgi:hypothetical protein
LHSTPFYLALLVRLDSRCGQNQLERGQAVPSRPSTFQPISHRTFSGQHVASPILRGVASHDCSQRFGSTHSHGSARPQPAGISICSKSLHGQSGYSFCCGRRSYASTCVPRSTLSTLQCSCLLDPLRLRPALQDEPRRAKRVWGPSLAENRPRTPPLLCENPARVCASACACNGGVSASVCACTNPRCKRKRLHKPPPLGN